MNRWLGLGMLAALMVGSTGCLHHNVRGGGACASGSCGTPSCSTGGCQSGGCQSGACESCDSSGTVGILSKVACKRKSGGDCGCSSCGSGLLGRIGGLAGVKCKDGCGCGGQTGCVTGGLGWQQGGHDYSSYLQPGLMGHGAGAQLTGQSFTPGPPTGQVAYPYYSVRGPRDFLMANPPSIGR